MSSNSGSAGNGREATADPATPATATASANIAIPPQASSSISGETAATASGKLTNSAKSRGEISSEAPEKTFYNKGLSGARRARTRNSQAGTLRATGAEDVG